jgi:hypothetical protein
MKNITSIAFPNTAVENQGIFVVGKSCDEIRQIKKNGEMASITWLQIIKDGHIVAEIKESVCEIYGKDPIEKPIF